MKSRPRRTFENGTDGRSVRKWVEATYAEIRVVRLAGCLVGVVLSVVGVVHVFSAKVSARSLQLTGFPARLYGIFEIMCALVLVYGSYKAWQEMRKRKRERKEEGVPM
jgi:threonine/homoserine/homoserine lactone efflux protein